MVCGGCGVQNAPGARVCGACGASQSVQSRRLQVEPPPARQVISGGPGRFPNLGGQVSSPSPPPLPPAAPVAGPTAGPAGGGPATFTRPALNLPDVGVTRHTAMVAARNGLIVVAVLYVAGIVIAGIAYSAFSSFVGQPGVGGWFRVGGLLAGVSFGGRVSFSAVGSGSPLFGTYSHLGVGWQPGTMPRLRVSGRGQWSLLSRLRG